MCLLLEGICVVDGRMMNRAGHQRRVDASRADLLGLHDALRLDGITVPEGLRRGKVKCRVLYDRVIHAVEFHPHEPRPLRTLRLVHADGLEYGHKYADRRALDELRAASGTDDVLIVRDGFITDISFANIAFFDGHCWVTPSTPLLNGTKRQRLLARGALTAVPIRPTDLHRHIIAAPINAMLDIGDVPFIDVRDIQWAVGR